MSAYLNTPAFKEKIPHGYRKGSFQQFDPSQMDLYKNLFQYLGPESYLSRLAGGDEETFAQLEAPALRQFQGLQGQLASRFSGMGLGARRSSGFQNVSTQAAQELAQNLAARRAELQSQAIKEMMTLGESLLSQRPYQQYLVQKSKKPSFFQSLMGGVSPAAGAGLGYLLGGPSGSMLGYNLGQSAAQAFL